MPEITTESLRNLCRDETIFMTQHAYNRCRERGIKYADLKEVICSGEIIEQYPNDYPYPSCLILGATLVGQYIHVVCGVGAGRLWIITAYLPDPNKWINDFKTRKENH